jgi:hypothetical protein
VSVESDERAYKYRCMADNPHEFVITARSDNVQVGNQMQCVANGCFAWAILKGLDVITVGAFRARQAMKGLR